MALENRSMEVPEVRLPRETFSAEWKCGNASYMQSQLRNHIPNQLSGQPGHKILVATADIPDSQARDVCKQYGAALQWSRTVSDIPDGVRDAMERVQNYAESQLENFCARGVLVRELSGSEETQWNQCVRRSETLRRLLGSCVVLAGEKAKTVREALAETPEVRFIVEALDHAQSLILV